MTIDEEQRVSRRRIRSVQFSSGLGIAIVAILIVAALIAASSLRSEAGPKPSEPGVDALLVGYASSSQVDVGPDVEWGVAESAAPDSSARGTSALAASPSPALVPSQRAPTASQPVASARPSPTPSPPPTPAPTPNYVRPSAAVVSPVNGIFTTSRVVTWTYLSNGGPGQAWYWIQVATDPGFGAPILDTAPVDGGATTYAIPAGVSLTLGSAYYWRVAVANVNVGSDWSAAGSFFWGIQPTATIVSPDGGVLTTSRTLTWAYHDNGGPGQGCFRIQVSTYSDFAVLDIVNTLVTCYGASNWTMPDVVYLAHGTTFYWHVTVANGYTGSAWSPTGYFVWNG